MKMEINKKNGNRNKKNIEKWNYKWKSSILKRNSKLSNICLIPDGDRKEHFLQFDLFTLK